MFWAGISASEPVLAATHIRCAVEAQWVRRAAVIRGRSGSCSRRLCVQSVGKGGYSSVQTIPGGYSRYTSPALIAGSYEPKPRMGRSLVETGQSASSQYWVQRSSERPCSAATSGESPASIAVQSTRQLGPAGILDSISLPSRQCGHVGESTASTRNVSDNWLKSS